MTFLFTYIGRVNPTYYLLWHYTLKGESKLNALLMCVYLLIFIYPADKAYHKLEVGWEDTGKIKEFEEIF